MLADYESFQAEIVDHMSIFFQFIEEEHKVSRGREISHRKFMNV